MPYKMTNMTFGVGRGFEAYDVARVVVGEPFWFLTANYTRPPAFKPLTFNTLNVPL